MAKLPRPGSGVTPPRPIPSPSARTPTPMLARRRASGGGRPLSCLSARSRGPSAGPDPALRLSARVGWCVAQPSQLPLPVPTPQPALRGTSSASPAVAPATQWPLEIAHSNRPQSAAGSPPGAPLCRLTPDRGASRVKASPWLTGRWWALGPTGPAASPPESPVAAAYWRRELRQVT